MCYLILCRCKLTSLNPQNVNVISATKMLIVRYFIDINKKNLVNFQKINIKQLIFNILNTAVLYYRKIFIKKFCGYFYIRGLNLNLIYSLFLKMQGGPFRSGQISNLAGLGIDQKFFKFNVTHLQSENYVTVRDVDANGNPQISKIQLCNKMNVVKMPAAKVEGAIMNWKDNIIALKAPNQGKGHILQIFNLDQKVKIKNIAFSENIVFWRWVTDKILAVVTTTSVYHVNIANENQNEVKIFQRSGDLKEGQVIGYCLSVDQKWSALFGISTPDGGQTINGHIQLYLIEGGKQQMIEGHACTFGRAFLHNDSHKSNIFAFVEKKAGEKTSRVTITQISAPPQGFTKFKKITEIVYDPSTPNDFPISLVINEKYGCLSIITKFGFIYLYEINSNEQIFKTRISNDPIFVATKNQSNEGILAINKNGALIGGVIDQNNLIPYIMNNCKHIQNLQQIVVDLAGRYNLPGLENMFMSQFNNFLVSGDYANAAKIASMSPGTLLRNAETIQKFKGLPQTPGQPQPLLIYFQKLLEKGKLNKLETMELTGPVLGQGKIDLVRNWINNGKLDYSQQLGDKIGQFDKSLALKVYQESGSHNKVIQVLNELGKVDEAMKYAQMNNIPMDYTETLKSMMDVNPQGALNFAKKLYEKDKNMNVHPIADMFLQRNRIQEFTSFLFDCMRGNKQEDGPYQTKVLEVNIMIAPQIVESILQMKIWSQYNKPKIAALCEQKGLYQRALENYTDMKDIKRVLLNSHALPPEFIADYLSRMAPQDALACMGQMLKFNRQNIQTVVNVCVTNLQTFGAGNIVKMFESVGSFDGIFFFLGTVINSANDQEVHHKYIEAAAKCGQYRAIQEIVKNKRDCYDPVKVKDMLLEMKLNDPKPIIYLCDAHQQYDELTRYLYKNNHTKYIEVYLFKVCQNPKAIPVVLGTLIDLECEQSYIKQILRTVRSAAPMEDIIEQFDKRSKLSILETWLQDRVAENIQIPAIHNAMAKIKIDTNQNPQHFLLTNQFYDPRVVGEFCEDRDPHLAVLAYKRTPGTCDQELLDCTNRNSLYRIQAQYLVTRQSKDLWMKVLSEQNQHRKEIIDQVVSTALPESKNPQEVIICVQSFMEAELTLQLLALLEKIVLHNSDFSKYKRLQNLLIITAIKSDKNRVMDYLNRLDNYDGPEIAKIAMDPKNGLYQEALAIYKKLGMHSQALDILIEQIGDLQRAEDYAEKVNQNEVWSKLGATYLNNMKTVNAMQAFMKCKDHTFYMRVIGQMENQPESEQKDFKYPLFIKYLLMVRDATKDVNIDNALTFSYAKLDKLTELETFLSGTNSTDCQKVGDRCFAARRFEAAKTFYQIVRNNSKITSCLIQLKEYSQAIDAAKKANTPKTWKEVCMACVAAQQYKLANTAAMNIIIHPDQLEGLIKHYESLGVVNQMIVLLQSGVGLERAHIGIFTELAILYAKYKPEKLMEHCKTYMQKLNTTKLLRACQKYMLWKEAVFLYSHYNQYDQAVTIMMEHSPTAFNHQAYLQLIGKVSNNDLYYKSLNFYLDEQPLQINELLKALVNKIDLVKCTTVIRKAKIVELVEPFLKIVQQTNTKQVNQALNECYLQAEDYESLRQSITQYPNFDVYSLAKATENHHLLQFRRIAAYLYRKSGKFEQSINLSKKDEMYRDAIQTAQESDNSKIIQELLKFFVENKEQQFFAACLYTCYEYIRPDLVLQYGWRFNMYEFTMPYMIQLISELKTRVQTVQRKNEDRQKKEQQQAKEKMNQPLDFVSHDLQMMMPGGNLMLTSGSNMYNSTPPMNMMGQQPGGFGTQPGMGGGFTGGSYRGF